MGLARCTPFPVSMWFQQHDTAPLKPGIKRTAVHCSADYIRLEHTHFPNNYHPLLFFNRVLKLFVTAIYCIFKNCYSVTTVCVLTGENGSNTQQVTFMLRLQFHSWSLYMLQLYREAYSSHIVLLSSHYQNHPQITFPYCRWGQE